METNLHQGVKNVFFVGYPFGKKGWNMYDIENGEVFASRDVVYVETKFPSMLSPSGESSSLIPSPVYPLITTTLNTSLT